jgi:hypothetical protein
MPQSHGLASSVLDVVPYLKGEKDMENLSVNLFRITVVFNPTNIGNPITLLCNDIQVGESANGKQLLIPQGIAVIGLYVMTLPGGDGTQASFANEPVTWLNGTSANAFIVQSWDSGHVTIIDFNTVREASPHAFNVNVTYNGQTYSQDPTIINQPPIDG